MFKELGYEEAILSGRATAGSPLKSRPAPEHQPRGTLSESVAYFLGDEKIAVCHQYTLLDGGLGASGKPDPKMLNYKGQQFYMHSSPCLCEVCTAEPEDWGDIVRVR